jgi:hypothetical protein|tara:strand:- start:1489 stop:1737 length:249 start_codon:yes stop_codon:yes gene_type:complete
MTKTENQYYSILIDYLTQLESLVKDLDRRLTDLSEIEMANNQLLASLIDLSQVEITSRTLSEEESWRELVKLSAQLENWEKN